MSASPPPRPPPLITNESALRFANPVVGEVVLLGQEEELLHLAQTIVDETSTLSESGMWLLGGTAFLVSRSSSGSCCDRLLISDVERFARYQASFRHPSRYVPPSPGRCSSRESHLHSSFRMPTE